MSEETEIKNNEENGNVFITDVIGSAIKLDNEQVVLVAQFDDDEPIEYIRGYGDRFTLELKPESDNGGFITFTGKNGKTFKIMCKKHYL